jgi:hypothetical protein
MGYTCVIQPFDEQCQAENENEDFSSSSNGDQENANSSNGETEQSDATQKDKELSEKNKQLFPMIFLNKTSVSY